MANNEYSHIKTEIRKSPTEFDVAIVSINESGSFGGINQVVMGIYGYDVTSLDNVDTSKGYFLMQYESLKPILFIATVSIGHVGISLQKNLKEGINANLKFLKGKNVWVPLMGTGEGGLDIVDSYDTTIGVLKKFKDILFTIAIPDDNLGREFFNRFRIDNLQNKFDLKGDVKSGSSVSGTLAQEKPKQTGYDNMPGFNVHRLVRDVLNKEFNIDLSIDVITGRQGSSRRMDLADSNKESYVQIIEKSKFVGVKSDSAFTAGTSEVGIMSTIFADIENKINFLQSAGTRVQKYFALFSNSFTADNLTYAKKWFENQEKFNVDILTLNDIIQLAEKHKIDHKSYLQKTTLTEFDSTLDIDTPIAGSMAPHSTIKETKEHGPQPPPGLSNEEEIIDRAENNRPDKIPFHLDQVEYIDRLNRQPIAKSIARLLNKQIFSSSIKKPYYVIWLVNILVFIRIKKVINFTWLEKIKKEIENEKNSRYAFMVHLQGAWGDGKSTFLNLIESNLNSFDNKWVVIKFNAWQHQHLTPPWWPFLDQIYEQSIGKKSKGKVGRINSLFIRSKEWYRRLFKVKLTNRLITVFIMILLIWITIKLFPFIIEFAKKGTNSDTFNDSWFDNAVIISRLVGTLSIIIGAFFTIAQFTIRPLLLKSPETAKTFMERSNDPVMKIKKHFEALIGNIETSGFRVAVFIDDLDRCHSKFAVELLEGIQTLYKDRKVLYIVAGDKKWISTCFENHYDKFNNVIQEPKQKLGYLFIEKAFQLSIRLPKVSEIIISQYWEFILSGKEEKSEKQISDEKRDEILLEISEIANKFTDRSQTFMKDIREKYGLDNELATDIVLEAIDNSSNDFEHLFRYHYKLLKGNPRGIKRLANQYNIASNTLLAEFREFDKNKLFRWLILQNDYPVFTDWLEDNIDVENLSDKILDNWKILTSDLKWIALYNGDGFLYGEKFTIDDIKNLIGK